MAFSHCTSTSTAAAVSSTASSSRVRVMRTIVGMRMMVRHGALIIITRFFGRLILASLTGLIALCACMAIYSRLGRDSKMDIYIPPVVPCSFLVEGRREELTRSSSIACHCPLQNHQTNWTAVYRYFLN